MAWLIGCSIVRAKGSVGNAERCSRLGVVLDRRHMDNGRTGIEHGLRLLRRGDDGASDHVHPGRTRTGRASTF